MEKYVVYYKETGNIIKQFISLIKAVYFKDSRYDYSKIGIKAEELKENSFILDDVGAIIKSFNTLEEAKEFKLKQGNPYWWTIMYKKN